MVRRPVFAAEHRIRADGNMKCPRHFLVQQRVSAQVGHIRVHAEAQLADDAVFPRQARKVRRDRLTAAAGDLAVRDLQGHVRVCLALQIERPEEHLAVGLRLDRGDINFAAGQIAVSGIGQPRAPGQLQLQHAAFARPDRHPAGSGKLRSRMLAGGADSGIVDVICAVHAADILLQVEAGLGRVGLRRDADLRKAPARHKLFKQLRDISAVQLRLCILQLVSEHDRLTGEYVQDRVELRKQAKVPLIKAALLRARKDLPVDGPRLLQNDRRGAQRGDGGGKLIGDGLVGVFAPEVDQKQRSGRNAACFYDFCYGFARHTHTSSVSAIPSCSHRNVKPDLINIKINNQDPL